MRWAMILAIAVVAAITGFSIGAWGQVGFTATPVFQGANTIADQPIQFPLFRNQVTAIRVEIAPGGETGRHQHPNPTLVYVLEGTLTVEVEGQAQKVLTAGNAYLEPVNHWHNGKNQGTTAFKALVVFLGEEGKANFVRP